MASTANNDGMATFNIKVAGNAIPIELSVLSVRIEKRVNRVTSAKIVILDGEVNTGTFNVSSSDTFVPGNEVTIEAGYDNQNQTVFKGIITGQSLRIDNIVGSALEVECCDAAIKMTVGRKTASFVQKKDSEIIASVIAAYAGISSNVTETPVTWAQQVQYYATDWDFIVTLADANGLMVTTLNGNISVIKPDANTSPVLTVRYGDGLIEFNAKLNAVTQLGQVKASAWDYPNQAINSATAVNDIAGPGNLSSKKLAEVGGLADYQLQTTAPLLNDALTTWSKAQIVKSEYAKIQGEASMQGTSLADPGKYITLDGLGDRFNGDHLVSGVVHDISSGNWITRLSIGLSPDWLIEQNDVTAPPVSGLLPGVKGLFNGTVKQTYDDLDSQLRVLVDVPMFNSGTDGIWARLSNFYASNGAGAFFIPEVGDEVVLGFLNEDPRFPVILGSLYSSKNKPYGRLHPDEKNSIKSIVSKSGIAIQFDDTAQVLSVSTPGNNSMVLDDKNKQISIADQHQNSITMSADGITIKSPQNITIQAGQNIALSGDQGILNKSSGGDIVTSGLNIKETAVMQYSAQGNQTAKIQSGMELTLKGAMIMIN